MGPIQTAQPLAQSRRARGHADAVRQSGTRRATDARRKLERGDRGRMWMGAEEVGGVDRRYAHLDRIYD